MALLVRIKALALQKRPFFCSFHPSGKNRHHLGCRNVKRSSGCTVQNKGITLSLLCVFFSSSLFLSLARISNVCLLPSTKNPLAITISFAILEQSRVILSQAGRGRYIVICFNPTFTKMIDGTEKPKIPSKFAIRTAQYNKFCRKCH